MSISQIPWWSWAMAASILFVIVGPVAIWAAYRRAKYKRERVEIDARIAEDEKRWARMWRRFTTYDVGDVEDETSMRAALDRHVWIAEGLTIEQIHALCDTADKMRAENVKGNGDDNAS